MAAAQVPMDQIQITGEPKWYYVSENSRHGFCPECGSQMFWRNDTNDYMSLTGGCINGDYEIPSKGHIFTSEKGHYYDIPADEPQSAQWPKEEWPADEA